MCHLEQYHSLEQQIGGVDEHEALLPLSVRVSLVGQLQTLVLKLAAQRRKVDAAVNHAASEKVKLT